MPVGDQSKEVITMIRLIRWIELTNKNIESSPKSYYVSVCTTDYPLGALRGQL
jgi:hypothetical protein